MLLREVFEVITLEAHSVLSKSKFPINKIHKGGYSLLSINYFTTRLFCFPIKPFVKIYLWKRELFKYRVNKIALGGWRPKTTRPLIFGVHDQNSAPKPIHYLGYGILSLFYLHFQPYRVMAATHNAGLH